eukprot:TRINITY_DN64702_c0_g1_i1.p1 TRINITY_DN64702_c0_g1~~TRINITY_DN64702_c0_g1_i1.p1  ORF type:complete len:1094 (+),score=155.90 TRINITY_DN64702_c0_g1_i1:2337-5618(+)
MQFSGQQQGKMMIDSYHCYNIQENLRKFLMKFQSKRMIQRMMIRYSLKKYPNPLQILNPRWLKQRKSTSDTNNQGFQRSIIIRSLLWIQSLSFLHFKNRRILKKFSPQIQPSLSQIPGLKAIPMKVAISTTIDPQSLKKKLSRQLPLLKIQQRDFAKKVVPYPKEYTLVPYKQLTLLEEKALLEIERVKQKKEERLQKVHSFINTHLQKRIEENRKLIQEMKQKRTLRRQLEIRKVEHNIAPRNQKDIDFSLLLEEGVYEKAVPQKKEPNIELYTVEDEEDKDCEALKLFIEQHKRVFRYLYNRYANSGFSSKPKGSFDALKEKLSTISMAEIIKMLKDHSITLRMLSHSELASFIRLVNFKLIHKNDLTALTYQGFIELFVQIAIYIFSKEPYYNAHMPPVVHVEALLEHFKQAAKIKGENTALYDNPNATALGDPELMEELTKFVETNPFYPLPEGYKKVEEKYLHDNYVIPNYLVLPEATRFAVEIIDSMLNDALGIHVLEPITTYEYKVKVVPTIGKVYQRDPNEKRFMMPITKTLRKGILEPVKHPITLKQMNVKEIEPRLSPAIKLEVAKARKEMQPIIREVAEVVGEIVQAVEEGREGIGCRMKWGPSDILNKAIKDKLDKKREEELAKEEKEKQRKIRAVLIKNTVQELKREKARKEQEELELMYDVFGLYDLIFRKRQKEEEKKKFMKEKQLIEERKRKILEEKLKREEEEKKRIEEENKKSELERKKKAVELKVLKKRKELQFVLSEQTSTKQKQDLQQIIEAREKASKYQEEKKRLEGLKLEKHKKVIVNRLAKEREKREESKQQKLMLQEFMKRGDIVTLVTKYRKQLRHVFRYFSRLDDLEITHDLIQDINTLDLSKFSKLCIQFKLVPYLMSAEDAVNIFRRTIKAKIMLAKEQGKPSGKDTQYIGYGDFEELLIRIALLVRHKIDESGDMAEGELNKTYDINGADARIVHNLIRYMRINPDDTKITLDHKLNAQRMEGKKIPFKRPNKKYQQTISYEADTSMQATKAAVGLPNVVSANVIPQKAPAKDDPLPENPEATKVAPDNLVIESQEVVGASEENAEPSLENNQANQQRFVYII